MEKGKGSTDCSGKGSGQSTAWVERRRCHSRDQVGNIAVHCTQPKRRPGANAVSEASSAQTQAGGKLSVCSTFQRQRIIGCDNPEACASLGCGNQMRAVGSMRDVVLSSVPIVPVANQSAHLAVDTHKMTAIIRAPMSPCWHHRQISRWHWPRRRKIGKKQ